MFLCMSVANIIAIYNKVAIEPSDSGHGLR